MEQMPSIGAHAIYAPRPLSLPGRFIVRVFCEMTMKPKAPNSSKGFYVKAKQHLWLQAFGLCSILGVELAVDVAQALTTAGKFTSITFWYFEVKRRDSDHPQDMAVSPF